MKLIKCNRCALINTENDSICRRCKQDLVTNPLPLIPTIDEPLAPVKKSSYAQYVLVGVIVGIALVITCGVYFAVSAPQ